MSLAVRACRWRVGVRRVFRRWQVRIKEEMSSGWSRLSVIIRRSSVGRDRRWEGEGEDMVFFACAGGLGWHEREEGGGALK